MLRWTIANWLVSIAAGTALVACSSVGGSPGGSTAQKSNAAGANPPEVSKKLDEYYQRAQASKELRVVHYGGPGPEYEEIIKEFRRHYPDIEVETVTLRGPDMIQRLQAESASGKIIANVGSHGQTTMTTLDAAGMLQQWEGPPTAALLPEIPLTTGGVRWPQTESIYGYIANTQLVPPDKMPKSREDLLDPFWKGKGKLLIEDPRGNGPGLDVFTMNYVHKGQAWLDAIKAQEPTFVRDRDAAPTQIARGEYAIFYPVGTTREQFDLEKVAPVKVDWLRDGGSTVLTGTVSVIKNGPAQDAARLWVSWLTSFEGQRVMTDQLYSHPALPGVQPATGLPPFSEVNPSRRSPDEIRRNNEFIEIFDRTFFK
ncbi:MAG: ABC transporter substrate-binding protein [Chloroflexota bacterium]